MSQLKFLILGPTEVYRNGVEVPLDGTKQRTVLAALLLTGSRVLPDSTLSDLLWGEHPPETYNAQIYTYVSRLRKSLSPEATITRRAPGYIFRFGGAELDVAEFGELSRLGQTALLAGRFEDAAMRLRAALALWRGPALADVSERLADVEAARLEEARTAVMESCLEADLALGKHQDVLPELTALVRDHPLREGFRAQLMTSLYRCDRQADALALYDEGRRILADELGIDPGRRLREVHQAILSGDLESRIPNIRSFSAGVAI